MNTFAGALLIARNDFRRFTRDKTGAALGFLLPIVLILVFGFINKLAFQGEEGMVRTELWVTDLDGSAASKAFVAALRKSSMLRIKPGPDEEAPDEAEMKKKVEDGEEHHALVIPPGYGAALAERRFPELRMYRDPGREMEKQLVGIGLMQAFISAGSADVASLLSARALTLAGLPEAWTDNIKVVTDAFARSVDGMFRKAGEEGLLAASQPAEEQAGIASAGTDFAAGFTRLVPVTNIDVIPPERPRMMTFMLAQSVSGMAVMMLMFGLVACGSSLIREREGGTLPRLLLSALPRDSILFGKMLFCCWVGALQLVVMFSLGGLVFQVNLLRDPVTLLVLSVVLLLAVTAFGILIAACSRTEKQAEGLSTLLILVMSALGGAWFPIALISLPPIAEIVTRSTLTFWAMSGMQGMLWHGKSWTDPTLLLANGVLLGFTVVAISIALWRFRKRYANVK